MPSLPLGMRLGPYEILASIGAGGMGELYKGSDTRLNRTVAIKILPPHFSENPGMIMRFEREAQAIAGLNHPNICTLFDVGRQGSVAYLVMEYLEGKTLGHRLEKGPLPLADALKIAIDIAEALETAHREGVVHRDLKPSNVMLSKTGTKLLDFGLAKLKTVNSTDSDTFLQTTVDITTHGMILGTVQYMAPEQLEGNEADSRSDIFALGEILYEMISGRKAFAGNNQAVLISAIMTSDPTPLSKILPIPAALDHAVHTSLAKDPEQRWQAVGDLKRQLKWIAEGGAQRGVSIPVVIRQQKRILIVDDEPDLEVLIGQRFRRKIKEGELEFVFSRNGQEALARLKEDPTLDIVMSDINMPVMDGLTLLSRLNDMDRTLKTIIVSAYGDMLNIRTAMNRGAYDFLTKPIDFQDFEVTLNRTIQEIEAIKQGLKAREQLVAIQHELGVAAKIQQSILPREFPPFPSRTDFDLFAEMMPTREVGGDFYDFFLIDQKRLGIVIGDVYGKSVPAAIFMAISRTLLKARALEGGSAGVCLQYVNDVLAKQADVAMCVTIFYGILHTDTGELEYSAGGPNFAYVLPFEGSLRELGETSAPIVGAFAHSKFITERTQLNPGDSLVLFTDGVIDSVDTSGQKFTEQRLKEILDSSRKGSAREIVKNMVNAVQSFSGTAEQTDDITALALKYQVSQQVRNSDVPYGQE